MNWDNLKIFLEVAEAKSMRAAAKKLKVSHSKVSRRIESLEIEIGVKLFDRLPDGYRLTAAGQELHSVALNTDEKLHQFGRNVAGRDDALEGQICVTVPDAIMEGLFMDIFLKFMNKNKAIQIKINDSYQVFNLSRREADIAIRFTNKPPDHLIGRRLGNMHQAAYATREYVKQFQPENKNSTARWIGWGLPEDHPSWIRKSIYPHLKIMGHINNVLMQLDVTRRGGGIGYFPCYLGDSHPDLIRLSDPEPSHEVWLLSHHDLRSTARMRAFRQFIITQIPHIELKLKGQVN